MISGDSGLMRAEDEMDVQLLEEREKSMCQLEVDIIILILVRLQCYLSAY